MQDRIAYQGITFDDVDIQWTNETQCFLVEGKSTKPAAMTDLKPAMKVEVKLASKVDRSIVTGAPPRLLVGMAAEVLILEMK